MVRGSLQEEIAFDFLTRTRTPVPATTFNFKHRMARTKINAKQRDKNVLQLQQGCFFKHRFCDLVLSVIFGCTDDDLQFLSRVNVLSGAPQCLHLAPTVFVIFIRDVCSVFKDVEFYSLLMI